MARLLSLAYHIILELLRITGLLDFTGFYWILIILIEKEKEKEVQLDKRLIVT